MDLRKVIQELKEEFSAQHSNDVDLEKYFRELKTELYMKRDENKKLKTELENADSERHCLKRALDAAKRTCEENDASMKILFNKAKVLEKELLEKGDVLTMLEMQHKMSSTALEALKEKLESAEIEKSELCRKVENLDSKQKYSRYYHNEILKRDSQLDNMVREVREMMTKLQVEHKQVMDLSKELRLAEASTGRLEILTKRLEKMEQEKNYFEECYVKVNAKYEKLEELMANYGGAPEPDLLNKVIFAQWQASRRHHQEITQQKNDIIAKLTDAFSQESSTNIKLINENEKLCEINKKLRKELDDFKELEQMRQDQPSCENATIKTEVIEVE